MLFKILLLKKRNQIDKNANIIYVRFEPYLPMTTQSRDGRGAGSGRV